MLLVLAHAAATWFLVGLIWVIQVVHYPLMAQVAPAHFERYQQAHMSRITWVVAPMMLIEAFSALWIALSPPLFVPPVQAWMGLGLVLLIWISTAALSVPAHNALLRGFEPKAHRRLVQSNWFRTIGWSLRAVMVSYWMLLPSVATVN